MGRGSVQEQDNIPASPQGAHHVQMYLKLLLITVRRVMDQQPTSQTHGTIKDMSCMITHNRHESLRALPRPFGS